MLSAGLSTRPGEYIKQHHFFEKKGEQNTMNKIKNSKGFTLMEMLIVVAIIAVLVAIAIPTFTTSLNKARVATDEANIRSGYASVMAEVLTNQISTEDAANKGQAVSKVYTLAVDGTIKGEGITNTAADYSTVGQPKTDETVNIAGMTFTGTKLWTKGQHVYYTYNGATNKVTISFGANAPTTTP